MARARILPDGVTAPTVNGRSIQERRKRTSSSRGMPFLSSNCLICCSIFLPMPSRFSSNSRIWRSILRSMMFFLTSRRRNCRPIFFSNFCRAGSGMRVTQKTLVQAFARDKFMSLLKHSGGKNHIDSGGAGAGAEPVEELLDLAEKARGFGMGFGRRQAVEFGQKLA